VVSPCPAIRMRCPWWRWTMSARVALARARWIHGAQGVGEQFHLVPSPVRVLKHAVEQLNTSASMVRSHAAGFEGIPNDRPLIGLVVTMEPFHTVDTPFTRSYLRNAISRSGSAALSSLSTSSRCQMPRRAGCCSTTFRTRPKRGGLWRALSPATPAFPTVSLCRHGKPTRGSTGSRAASASGPVPYRPRHHQHVSQHQVNGRSIRGPPQVHAHWPRRRRDVNPRPCR
jgi:hypothetical protein